MGAILDLETTEENINTNKNKHKNSHRSGKGLGDNKGKMSPQSLKLWLKTMALSENLHPLGVDMKSFLIKFVQQYCLAFFKRFLLLKFFHLLGNQYSF